MAKLDFFSFGSKRQAHPLDDAKSVSDWHAGMLREVGTGCHDQIAALLAQFNADIEHPSVQTLEAILELDKLGHLQHEQLCAQFLNSRLPAAIESQQRTQILAYGRQFVAAFQRFMGFDPDSDEAVFIRRLLPQIIGKMLHYLTEYALWQYYRHAVPEPVIWSTVNQLFSYAEEYGIDAVPVVLYPEQSATTIHDLYLALLMVSLLGSGNLSARQVRIAYQLALLLSSHMVLSRDFMGESSFMISLHRAEPPCRSRQLLPSQLGGMRVWSTSALIDQLNIWLAICDAGNVPGELRQLTGVDVALLRFLAREWAVKPFRFDRAERVAVESKQLEIGRQFPLVHRLVREYEELAAQGTHPVEAGANVEEAAELRIYGFVTSRRRDKPVLQNSSAKAVAGVELLLWDIENQSDTGLGVSLPAQGADWVALGAMLATREVGQSAWGLSIVRRIKRVDRERLYLGLQLLTLRPVAAYTKQENGRNADPTLPPGMIWNQGEIALFASTLVHGVKRNSLIIPLFSYVFGKRLQMFAKNKGFLVSLGRMLEKGQDWCQVEIELVRPL